MTGRLFIAFLLITAFSLGACAPRATQRALTVDRMAVPAFHGGTVTVRAYPREMNDSLEYKVHRPALEAGLIAAGLEIASRDNARYVAYLDLDGAAKSDRRGGAALQLASTLAAPTALAEPGVRVVSLRIVEAQAPRRTVFSGTAALPTSCAQSPEAVRAMISAVLSQSSAPRIAC